MPTQNITIFTATAILKDSDIIEIYKALNLPEIVVSDPILPMEFALFKTGLNEYLRKNVLQLVNPYIDSLVSMKQNEIRQTLKAETEQSISVNFIETDLESFISSQQP